MFIYHIYGISGIIEVIILQLIFNYIGILCQNAIIWSLNTMNYLNCFSNVQRSQNILYRLTLITCKLK